MKNLILTLIITLPLTLWGQGWEETYGGEGIDEGHSIQQTTDGGYIICGTTYSFGNGESDVYLIKTDSQGDSIWTKTFGGVENDEGHSVQQTTDGGFIITGSTKSFGNGESDVYIIKTDVNGNEEWSQTYGGPSSERGYSVQQTTDGGYIVTGSTYSFGNGFSDVWLIKTDVNGNEEWSQIFGTGGLDSGNSVQQTSDGGYIICGKVYSNYNIWLIKTDEDGNELWNKEFGDQGYNDFGKSVLQTIDGGYIITGRLELNGFYVLLLKTDENGNELWSKTFGGTGYSVQQTSDGGYIITGDNCDDPTCNNPDVLLIKIDENGNELWNQTFGGTNNDDRGHSVQQTTDGGYIVTGSTYSFGNGSSDVWLIKTDDQGNITSTTEIQLPNPDKKLEKTVNLIGQEIKPQTNSPIIEIFDDGSVEKKIVVE